MTKKKSAQPAFPKTLYILIHQYNKLGVNANADLYTFKVSASEPMPMKPEDVAERLGIGIGANDDESFEIVEFTAKEIAQLPAKVSHAQLSDVLNRMREAIKD